MKWLQKKKKVKLLVDAFMRFKCDPFGYSGRQGPGAESPWQRHSPIFHGVITATAPNCGSKLHPVFRPQRLSLLQRSSREDPRLPLRCFPANEPENRSVLVLFLPLVTWDLQLTRDFNKLELQNKKTACLFGLQPPFILIDI